MRGRRSFERQQDFAVFPAGDELVLGACTRYAAKVVGDAEGTVCEISEEYIRLRFGKLPELWRTDRRRFLAGFPERNRPRAVAADCAEKSERVIGRQAQNLRNSAAHALVWKKVGKERHDVALFKSVGRERER